MTCRPRWPCLLLALAAHAAGGQAPPFEKLERQMAEIVNRERARHKLPPLAYRAQLAAVARAHSLDMKTHHFMAHKSPRTGGPKDRVAKARIPFRAAAENIAVAPSVEAGHQWLMNSPKHRDNILHRKLSHIGIGILRNEHGWLVITQLFLTPPPQHNVEALRTQILEGINKRRAAQGLRRLVGDATLTKWAAAHSERAAQLGSFDPPWLQQRLEPDRRRWRLHEAQFFLTDDVAEVIASPVAQGKEHDHYGIGIVQAPLRSKAKGALWVTLVCAQAR